MYPHVIRLRGPWECTVIDESANARSAEPLRVTPPCDVREVLGDEFRGRVKLRRAFHAPMSLVANEALWLVIESIGGPACVTLDDELLAEIAPSTEAWECEITGRQRQRMVLEIDLTVNDATSGPTLGAVRLEVREARR
jgi:hypothetical protein